MSRAHGHRVMGAGAIRRHVGRHRRGFTLIEVLVVVAIIALLVAILLPSLQRAREQTRLVVCQANIRQVGVAFLTYANVYKGRLPGQRGDFYADWLGGYNVLDGSNNPIGRQPEDGTIFKKYAGGQTEVYVCPSDNEPRIWAPNKPIEYSYTSHMILSGAKPESLAGAHFRYDSANPKSILNYSETDHRQHMKPFEGVPVLIEQDPKYLVQFDDSGWCYHDGISSRHLGKGVAIGFGSLFYHDGHVGRVSMISESDSKVMGGLWPFRAKSLCIRTTGNKWVSGMSWDYKVNGNGFNNRYGLLDSAPDASHYNVMH